MRGNIAQLMQQAQKMQENLQKAQEELAKLEVTGTAGGGMVSVTLTGAKECRKVRIDPSILSDAEMIQAANRQIPTSFAEAMEGLDPKLQMQIAVTWASLTTVNRMDPLLLLVAHEKNITPEQLDALFGFVPD